MKLSSKHNLHLIIFSTKARNCPPYSISRIYQKSEQFWFHLLQLLKKTQEYKYKSRNGLCKMPSFALIKKKKETYKYKNNLFKHDKDAVDLCQTLDYNHKY